MRKFSEPKKDIYETVTQQIIDAIEAGEATYEMPWQSVPGLPKNIASGRDYRGINTLLLWLIGHSRGYSAPHWATFKQWAERGHPVRKGEKAATVVFWKDLRPDSSDADGDTEERPRFVARAYWVFNASQVEGYVPSEIALLPESERVAQAEAFFSALPIDVRHGGSQAFYQPSTDEVHLPEFQQFKAATGYYATRGHESIHATGAKSRLHRDLTGRFGSESYAMEELVAELGAAFLCAHLGISSEPRTDHAGYIESWLRVLKSDTRAVFAAAGKAQQAVDWLIENRRQE